VRKEGKRGVRGVRESGVGVEGERREVRNTLFSSSTLVLIECSFDGIDVMRHSGIPLSITPLITPEIVMFGELRWS